MSFQNTPDDVETGTYSDATVDETETEEVWIEVEFEEDGETATRAFGFILIPKENVPWHKKNEIVQDIAQRSRGGFDAVAYYKEIFDYQVQDTSFLPENTTVKAWLDEGASDRLVREVEDLAPDPLNLDGDEEGIADAVKEIVENYAEGEGEWTAPVEHFYSWLDNQTSVAEGDTGK